MKAFQLNDYEIWAANSIEEAIDVAERETGERADIGETHELDDDELDRPIPMTDQDGSVIEGETTTLRAELACMMSPGLLAACDC